MHNNDIFRNSILDFIHCKLFFDVFKIIIMDNNCSILDG